MKLRKFSVTDYRSITKAHKINVKQTTVLVGKNNEGKSNLLRALAIAMDIMIIYARDPRFANIPIRQLRGKYEWERDFPLSKQEDFPEGKSVLDLEFELSKTEIAELKLLTRIRIDGLIPVRIKLGQDRAAIEIPKRGSSSFKEQKQRITEFICKKISFNFIPAVRTEEDAISVIESIIGEELFFLEKDPAYRDARQLIKEMQQSVLDGIALRIQDPLKLFLPKVQDVKLELNEGHRRVSLRRDIRVLINDGALTEIQTKGDGVKSLTALAMLNAAANENAASVVAIEEPESHLHPAAIHQLVDVINDLSESRQVIITTHNPLFVFKNNIEANIIVDSGSAKAAKSIKEIRDVLGVLPDDNLVNARFVLLVEGEDDKLSLSAIIKNESTYLKKAIENNSLEIKAMGGASKLASELNTLNNWMCKTFVFLDHDEEGKKAAERAVKAGLIKDANIKYATCNGQTESEFEDCLDSKIYKDSIKAAFNVELKGKDFRNKNKWSKRVHDTFLSSGQTWNERIEEEVKLMVAQCVVNKPKAALNSNKRSSVDALINTLENFINTED